MNVEAVARAVESELRALGTEERRSVASWYFPTSMRVHGVTVPDLRRVARDLSREHRAEPADAIVALADALVEAGSMEGRQVAYELVASHRAAREAIGEKDVVALGRGMDNWGSVDAFSVLVAGPAWRRGAVRDGTIARWAASKDRWWRRAALVATVPLNMRSRGGKGDTKHTLDVCTRLAADHDDMVEKALSWALRELLEHDPASVRAFLAEHEAALGKRVLREVRKKLETGTKSGRKKEK